MFIEVVCGKCNYVIHRMIVLRAVKDVVKDKRCPNCNAILTQEFDVVVERI